MKALVLSAETPSACATVRALHAVGFQVTVLAEAWYSPAALSRCCRRSLRVGAWKPAELEGYVAADAPDVVVPVSDGDLVRLASVRAAIDARAKVLAPRPDVLEEATDKVFTAKAAEVLGIAIPQQTVLSARESSIDAPPDPFPLVAKPARSRVLRPDGVVRGGTASYVADLGALRAIHAANAAFGVDTIVQRPLDGVGILASVLVREDGELSLDFVHRRVREARPEGGPSACAVSIAPDRRFVEPAQRLATLLKLHGVPVQFEFRVAGDAPPVLLDVNPRPWGTLGLSLDCGVNFHGIAARHLLGHALPAPPPPYRAGVQRHYLPHELRRVWALTFGKPQAGYAGPWPDWTHAMTEWVFPPGRGLVGRVDDPLPAFGDAVRLTARALSHDGR